MTAHVGGARLGASACLILSILVAPQVARAATPAETFARCYTQMTRRYLAPNHPMLVAVKAGRKSAADACVEILRGAVVSRESGELVNKSSDEARATFQTFFDHFRSWFAAQDFRVGIEMAQARQMIHTVHDSYAAPLHVLNAFVRPGARYDGVLDSDQHYTAVRSSGGFRLMQQGSDPQPCASSPPDGVIEFDRVGPKRRVNGTGCVEVPGETSEYLRNFDPLWVETGEIYGVRPYSATEANRTMNARPFNSYDAAEGPSPLPIRAEPIPIYRSYAGAIGTHSYLVLNFGKAQQVMANGGNNLPRRWAQATFRDFLCRDLPLLRDSDVAGPTAAYTAQNNHPSFRYGTTCMQCHAGMDEAAASLRNIYLRDVSGINNDIVVASKMSVDQPAIDETLLPRSDRLFSRRPPRGTLFFRNLRGELVAEPTTDIRSLAQAFSRQDEYYVCAASRLFEFFTGVKIVFTDPAIQDKDDEIAAKFRPFVVDLGSKLRRHQSLMTTAEEILRSKEYQEAR